MLLFVCPGSKPISRRAKAQISVIRPCRQPFPVTNSCSPYLWAPHPSPGLPPPPASCGTLASRLAFPVSLFRRSFPSRAARPFSFFPLIFALLLPYHPINIAAALAPSPLLAAQVFFSVGSSLNDMFYVLLYFPSPN